MTTPAWIPVPGHSLDSVLRIPGSGALRTLLVICSAAQDGVAHISASDISLRAGLTPRSVFVALAQLEVAGCIVREARDPGPDANEIRLVAQSDKVVAEGPAPVTSGTPSNERSTHRNPHADIPLLLSSCYRVLNDAESCAITRFVMNRFSGDADRFARAVSRLAASGGVAPEASFNFCVAAIEALR